MQMGCPRAPVTNDENRGMFENAGPDTLGKNDVLHNLQEVVAGREHDGHQGHRYAYRRHGEAIASQQPQPGGARISSHILLSVGWIFIVPGTDPAGMMAFSCTVVKRAFALMSAMTEQSQKICERALWDECGRTGVFAGRRRSA